MHIPQGTFPMRADVTGVCAQMCTCGECYVRVTCACGDAYVPQLSFWHPNDRHFRRDPPRLKSRGGGSDFMHRNGRWRGEVTHRSVTSGLPPTRLFFAVETGRFGDARFVQFGIRIWHPNDRHFRRDPPRLKSRGAGEAILCTGMEDGMGRSPTEV